MAKLLPHLVGDEASKEAALVALAASGFGDLAVDFASLRPTAGSMSALALLTQNSNDSRVKGRARSLLKAALAGLEERIVRITRDGLKWREGVQIAGGRVVFTGFSELGIDGERTAVGLVVSSGESSIGIVRQLDLASGFCILSTQIESERLPTLPQPLREMVPGDRVIALEPRGYSEPMVGVVEKVTRRELGVAFSTPAESPGQLLVSTDGRLIGLLADVDYSSLGLSMFARLDTLE